MLAEIHLILMLILFDLKFLTMTQPMVPAFQLDFTPDKAETIENNAAKQNRLKERASCVVKWDALCMDGVAEGRLGCGLNQLKGWIALQRRYKKLKSAGMFPPRKKRVSFNVSETDTTKKRQRTYQGLVTDEAEASDAEEDNTNGCPDHQGEYIIHATSNTKTLIISRTDPQLMLSEEYHSMDCKCQKIALLCRSNQLCFSCSI